jgi:hypothetical protein
MSGGMVTATSSSIAPRAAAALQKVAADKLRTEAAAVMAVPSRPADAVLRHLPRRSHSLVLGQQTIGSIRCGTLMRHVIFARPVAACARRMIGAAVTAPLVTATSFALRASARFPGAAFGAINMTAIAMAADQYLDPAALTQEQSRRHSIGLAIPTRMRGLRLMPWTQSLPGAMMPLHSCSGTVWGTAPMRTATLGSVPCLLGDIGRVLSRQPIACQALRARAGQNSNQISGNWKTAAPFAARQSAWAVASIKMSVGGFDDARINGE